MAGIDNPPRLQKDLEDKYGVKFEVPVEVWKDISYKPFELSRRILINLMLEQNEEFVQSLIPPLRQKIAEEISLPVCASLELEAKIPELMITKLHGGMAAFKVIDDKATLMISPLKALEWTKNGLDKHILGHEFGHYLSHVFNRDKDKFSQCNLRFSGGYGKGNSIETQLIQSEGFAQWVGGGNDGYFQNYEELKDKLEKADSPWMKEVILRKEFDTPYSFGRIIFNLIERIGGGQAVKELAFDGLKSRQDMIRVYQKACQDLGLEPLVAKPRFKRLCEVYEEMLGNKVVENDNELKDTLTGIDHEIEKQLAQGREPKILMWYDASALVDVLSECYWHTGVMGFLTDVPSPSEEMYPYLNFGGGDLFDTEWELLEGINNWTIFVDKTRPDGSLGSILLETCSLKEIAYFENMTKQLSYWFK